MQILSGVVIMYIYTPSLYCVIIHTFRFYGSDVFSCSVTLGHWPGTAELLNCRSQ